RDAAHAAVLAVLASPEWRGLLLDLVAWTQTGPWLGEGGPPERDGPARDFAGLVLDRFRKRVKKRGRDLAGLDPEARHRVRIAAKKLRYGAD
ncbi:CHAD domain-containing protein, partial [Enterobacter hormaechei]|uniref:CHAD domain-containing protein n=5 Tax=Pseudomonadota TaxID=1224 RepID=UPI0013D4D3B0